MLSSRSQTNLMCSHFMQREYIMDFERTHLETGTCLITSAAHFFFFFWFIRTSKESDCESELSPASLLSMLSTQLTQKIIPVYASRSGSQFSPRCSITRNPISDCIHHGVFRRTSDGCAFLDKLLTTGREGNALGLCARQRLMIKDSEVCFSPRLSLSLHL